MRFLRLLKLNEPRSHMVVLCAVFFAIGITLLLQPTRYENTPSYANLLVIFRQATWGSLYLLAAALQIACIWRYTHRTLIVVTHTVVITLISVWLVAFVIRYATDSGTTVVNVASWSTYLYLAVRSALMLDEHVRTEGE
jgi:hypothetical protein